MPTQEEIELAYREGVEVYTKGDFWDQVGEARPFGPSTEPLDQAHDAGYRDAVNGKVK